MKYLLLIFLPFLPTCVISQDGAKFELSVAPNLTHYTKADDRTDTYIGYDLGMTISVPMKDQQWEYIGGLRFFSYRGLSTKENPSKLMFLGRSENVMPTEYIGGPIINQTPDSFEVLFAAGFKSIINLKYLGMPLGVKYHLLKKGGLNVDIQGEMIPMVFIAWRVKSTASYKGLPDKESIHSGKIDDYRKFNLAAGISIGLEYPVSKSVGILLQPHANLQMLSMSKKYLEKEKWYALGVRIGIRYLWD